MTTVATNTITSCDSQHSQGNEGSEIFNLGTNSNRNENAWVSIYGMCTWYLTTIVPQFRMPSYSISRSKIGVLDELKQNPRLKTPSQISCISCISCISFLLQLTKVLGPINWKCILDLLLDAFSHLYKKVCLSIGLSVCLSYGLSVCSSHTCWNRTKVPILTKIEIHMGLKQECMAIWATFK